ncbi:MAG: hypothetical protein ACYC9L_16730 [Sulfuricaulis sp.]
MYRQLKRYTLVAAISILCGLASFGISLVVIGYYNGDINELNIRMTEVLKLKHSASLTESEVQDVIQKYYQSDEFLRRAHLRALVFSWVPWVVVPFVFRPLTFRDIPTVVIVLLGAAYIGVMLDYEIVVYILCVTFGLFLRGAWRSRLLKHRPA